MKRNGLSVIVFVFAAMFTSSAVAEQGEPPSPSAAPEPEASNRAVFFLPGWISRFGFSFKMSFGVLSTGTIPAEYRQVTAYRRTDVYELPDRTSGMYMEYSLGFSFSFAEMNWLAISPEITIRGSYLGGRMTWSEIDTHSRDYVGYGYAATTPRLSVKIIPFSIYDREQDREAAHVYLKAGVQGTYGALSSGTDANNQFTSQHDLSINGYSFIYGGGFYYYVFGLEFVHGVSFSGGLKMTENMLSLVGSLDYVSRGWCKRSFLPEFLCQSR